MWDKSQPISPVWHGLTRYRAMRLEAVNAIQGSRGQPRFRERVQPETLRAVTSAEVSKLVDL